MNIYDRIINILLEARIEDYLDRLDEGKVKRANKIMRGEWERQTGGKEVRRNVKKYGTGGSDSHELEQAQTADHRRQAHAAARGKRADEASNDAQLDYVGVMPIKKRKKTSREHGLTNLMRNTAAKHLADYRKKNPIGSPDRMAKRSNRYNRPYGRKPEPDYDY